MSNFFVAQDSLKVLIDVVLRNLDKKAMIKEFLANILFFIKHGKKTLRRGNFVKLAFPRHIRNTDIGDYTYISQNSWISGASIGKFCSIGPNLFCGWGIHPTTGISTSPSFYSTKKQNGRSFCKENKFEEKKKINIGNDVFIGANVTILDGVSIGNGAIIGAGAVVSKDIPPYAIAVGCPIRIIKYRFDPEVITQLQQIEWWNKNDDYLKLVEQNFWDVDKFIEEDKNYQLNIGLKKRS